MQGGVYYSTLEYTTCSTLEMSAMAWLKRWRIEVCVSTVVLPPSYRPLSPSSSLPPLPPFSSLPLLSVSLPPSLPPSSFSLSPRFPPQQRRWDIVTWWKCRRLEILMFSSSLRIVGIAALLLWWSVMSL